MPGGVKCAGGAAAPPNGIALSFKTVRQARPPELTSDTETLPKEAGWCRSRLWGSAQLPVRSESPLATLSLATARLPPHYPALVVPSPVTFPGIAFPCTVGIPMLPRSVAERRLSLV